ncbi:MAG: hypothetical protein SangKO_064420 [Sandaracinaceae bacterium]
MRSGIRGGGAVRPFSILLGFLALSLALAGCRRRGAEETEEGASAGGATPQAEEVEAGPPPEDWPRILVVGPGVGPALYLGHAENAPAVGYLNPGVRVRLESAPLNGRVEVLVAGALATKGWVPLSRVAAYAQHRGRVEGTRAYLAPGDLVGILGPAEDEGQMRVEVRPWMGGASFVGPFVGTFPMEHLADHPPEDDAEGVTPGDCYRLPAGQTVPMYERPGGEPVANLPPSDPGMTVTVLRARGDWYGVRAGFGPYLTGYVQGNLTACGGDAPAPEPMVPASDGDRPYWMGQESGPLHRVAAGTRVRFHGRTIARLRSQGWARELGRQDGGMVDVFVAVDEDVALRGLVPEDSLTLVEGASPAAAESAPAPAPEPEPEEDLPPELQ